MDKYDCLKLSNQLCFPIYVLSKEIVNKYTPLLKPYGLTYTQYLVLLVLFEEEAITVNELGQKIYLDSGTLSPLLKKLEAKGYIDRARSNNDERSVIISLKEKGKNLKEELINIPHCVSKCVNLNEEEAKYFYGLLYKVLEGLKNE